MRLLLKFNLIFPMRAVKHYRTWIGDSSLGEVARLVEDAGFDGLAMSEHPYPDRDWLSNGGHHAFDPFVSLSMAAEATSLLAICATAFRSGSGSASAVFSRIRRLSPKSSTDADTKPAQLP